MGATWQALGGGLAELPDPHIRLWERPAIDWDSPRWPHVYEATAYCSCPICCGKWSEAGLTASGVAPAEGVTVAVDRSRWAMGACLDIPGIGKRIAQDTGSAIVGNKVDIYLADHERAKAFGRRLVVVVGCNGRNQ